MRFCRFLLSKGRAGDARLLGRKTVELMMMNHLKGDLAAMGQPRFAESTFHGIGFGLGFSVLLDPPRAQIVGTPGECGWGGMASTVFWVDPAEDLAVVMMTQLIPSSRYPLRRELRVLTYQAIVD
jgi:CubicO group peptidase (beta-lactamase class C family)